MRRLQDQPLDQPRAAKPSAPESGEEVARDRGGLFLSDVDESGIMAPAARSKRLIG